MSKQTSNHCLMNKVTFNTLPTSANAVESHNRLSKSAHPDILKVEMMVTYRKGNNNIMSTTLESMAQIQGVSTTYDDLTGSARKKRSLQQSDSRRKHTYAKIPQRMIRIDLLMRKVF